MNKVFKKISFLLFFMFFVSAISVFAIDNFNTVNQKFSLENKIVSSETISKKLEGNITKDVATIVQEYFISSNLYSNYKYLKVSKNITYMDTLSNKNIASSRIEYNYRYNTQTRESECLSSTYVLGNYSDEYLLDISSKSLNKNTELGCALSDINFAHTKSPKKTLDKERYELTCDYHGKLDIFNVD